MELGALGEFIGAIAVVLTLVYLAIQVRHNKESLDAHTRSLERNACLADAMAFDEHDRRLNGVTEWVPSLAVSSISRSKPSFSYPNSR